MIVKTWQLTKKNKEKTLLDNISISLSEGKITGVIGSENSGKTTLLHVICGRKKFDKGKLELLEKPATRKSFQVVSFFQAGDILPGFMSGKELIKFCKGFYADFSLDKSSSYAEILKLDLNKKIHLLTPQNRELIKSLLCLSRDASVFLLDSPFIMLDAIHAELLKTVLFTRIQKDNTIMIAARDPNVLETVCDDFLILRNGKSIFYGDGEDLRLHRSLSMSSFYKRALSK